MVYRGLNRLRICHYFDSNTIIVYICKLVIACDNRVFSKKHNNLLYKMANKSFNSKQLTRDNRHNRYYTAEGHYNKKGLSKIEKRRKSRSKLSLYVEFDITVEINDYPIGEDGVVKCKLLRSELSHEGYPANIVANTSGSQYFQRIVKEKQFKIILNFLQYQINCVATRVSLAKQLIA